MKFKKYIADSDDEYTDKEYIKYVKGDEAEKKRRRKKLKKQTATEYKKI